CARNDYSFWSGPAKNRFDVW
nr:immunoglobulin heavy chain junction region [Macaca mulatta]MOW89530.1 immunoglobulin heavy chain junction region [Macaca mulatta]MOW91203.1 immunoglobulin heavy chain junction region [Macaca mulatta]MOW93018.1 immunoglobulin heavy chain junction region [Macaca mulatta]